MIARSVSFTMHHMKHAILISLLLFGAACKKSDTSASTTPAATAEPAATEPTAGDACYTDCMANGPGMPTSPEEFRALPPEEQENTCSAQCADANMPDDYGPPEE